MKGFPTCFSFELVVNCNSFKHFLSKKIRYKSILLYPANSFPPLFYINTPGYNSFLNSGITKLTIVLSLVFIFSKLKCSSLNDKLFNG